MSLSIHCCCCTCCIVRTISCVNLKYKYIGCVFSVQVKHSGMRYIFKSNFWLLILLSSHIIVHCKQFPKTVFVCFKLSVKILTMSLINFSHCLPCIVISKNISLICLWFLHLEGRYNDKWNWTVYTSEFKYHHYKFKFCFQFVLLSSYIQSRWH